jgi:hypothetical protein
LKDNTLSVEGVYFLQEFKIEDKKILGTTPFCMRGREAIFYSYALFVL